MHTKKLSVAIFEKGLYYQAQYGTKKDKQINNVVSHSRSSAQCKNMQSKIHAERNKISLINITTLFKFYLSNF